MIRSGDLFDAIRNSGRSKPQFGSNSVFSGLRPEYELEPDLGKRADTDPGCRASIDPPDV